MARCLVTGGAGYFGELLTRKLLERGHSVRIFDVNLPVNTYPGTEVVQADLRDADAVFSACEGIDVAFHNAAQVALAKDNDSLWSVNRDGTKNLLESCARRAVKKVIYTSSSAVYGVPKSNPVTEDTVPTPVEEYGKAKLAGETLCREYAREGLDVSIARPCTIMGHGRLGIFQILFEWIYQGRNLPVLNDGKNIYQFVHADDFAEACLKAGAREGAGAFTLQATVARWTSTSPMHALNWDGCRATRTMKCLSRVMNGISAIATASSPPQASPVSIGPRWSRVC